MPGDDHLSLLKKILPRLLSFVPTMLTLSIVALCFTRCAPDDSLRSFYDDTVESITLEELITACTRLGLNAPLTI